MVRGRGRRERDAAEAEAERQRLVAEEAAKRLARRSAAVKRGLSRPCRFLSHLYESGSSSGGSGSKSGGSGKSSGSTGNSGNSGGSSGNSRNGGGNSGNSGNTSGYGFVEELVEREALGLVAADAAKFPQPGIDLASFARLASSSGISSGNVVSSGSIVSSGVGDEWDERMAQARALVAEEMEKEEVGQMEEKVGQMVEMMKMMEGESGESVYVPRLKRIVDIPPGSKNARGSGDVIEAVKHQFQVRPSPNIPILTA